MSFHASKKNCMFKRFSPIARTFSPTTILIIALLVFGLWSLSPTHVLSHDVRLPENSTDSITVTLTIQSLLPPDETNQLVCGSDEMLVAHRAPVELKGLSWRGPLWTQTFLLFPATRKIIPPLWCGVLGYTFTLPEIVPQDGPLPEAPLTIQEASAPQRRDIAMALFAIVAVILLTFLFILKLRSLRTPDYLLRRLPPNESSLDLIPELIARKGITQRTHPGFFRELDQLRFAPTQPPQSAVRTIIKKAKTL